MGLSAREFTDDPAEGNDHEKLPRLELRLQSSPPSHWSMAGPRFSVGLGAGSGEALKRMIDTRLKSPRVTQETTMNLDRLTYPLSDEAQRWLVAAAVLVSDTSDHKLSVLTHDQLRNLVKDFRGMARQALITAEIAEVPR